MKKNTNKKIFIHILIIWVLGFAACLWIHSMAVQSNTLVENVLKSIADASRLFLFEYNISALGAMNGDLGDAVLIAKGVLMLLCILATLSTSILVITMFFSRVSSYVSFRCHRVTSGSNHLYVFWGVNEAAVLLARSVSEEYRGRTVRPYLIFVDNYADDEPQPHDFGKFVRKFCAPPNKLLDGCANLGEYTVARCGLSSIDEAMLQSDDIFGITRTGLVKRRISELLRHPEDAQLHIFFLGDNSDENIRSVNLLCRDATVRSLVGGGVKTAVYCHARYDSVNRVIEDCRSSDMLEVKVIDSSHESVNLLKRAPEAHPVNFVELDVEKNLGTVRTSFTSLVIGAGETGRDTIRFLYEFGAFVDSSSAEKVLRSPFNCYVVDARANEIGGRFMAFAPAVSSARNPDGSPLVSFLECSVSSPQFYSLLDELCDRLNYVVISLGSEELNASVAVTVHSYIRQRRPDLENIRIFVKSEGELQSAWSASVYAHYNSPDENVIIPFGKKKDIYTYGVVVSDDFEREGYAYYKRYTDLNSGRTDNETPAEQMWKERHAKIMKKISDNPSKKLEVWSELRRKEHQDLSNAYHRQTKMYIARAVCPELSKDNGMPQLLTDNLARLEHLRWNASHEILGYRHYDEEVPNTHTCNERLKRHNCLIPWQDLPEESKAATAAGHSHTDYISYDYGVVETSVRMELD